MIVKTDYQRSGLGDLIAYIKRDKDQRVPLRTCRGREMESAAIQDLIEKSREYNLARHMIISPDPQADYSTQEISRNTRMSMRDWGEKRTDAEWAYAVHGDREKPHSHVAITGPESNLRMSRRGIKKFRNTARAAFKERERVPERSAEREQSAEQERSFRNPSNADAEVLPDPDVNREIEFEARSR